MSRSRKRATVTLCLCLLCAAAFVTGHVHADPGGYDLAVGVEPTSVQAGDPVTYVIDLGQAGDASVTVSDLSHTLPVGFRYVHGSAAWVANDTVVSRQEPTVLGQNLIWRNQVLPRARGTSFYGMHTFVQDRCDSGYIGYQLDRVVELMGEGAYVKQLFYRITTETSGPAGCWVDFVNGCYDRNLVPIVRLAGNYGGPNWIKPPAASPGDYTAIAQAYARVVAGLPRRDNRPLYVEIWNEPNLDIEWSGEANPVEYAQFLVDASAAIRALGDPGVLVLNGALSPGGNISPFEYIDRMATVPGFIDSFDVWSVHPYPGNHPPEYNIHDGTAPIYPELTIDSYLLELDRLVAHGRTNVRVLLTETGYALGQNNFGFQGYAPIEEGNRADYIARAFADYWSQWPEIIGVCPYELVDPYGGWYVWDWLHTDGRRHAQYDAVRALNKAPTLARGKLRLRFAALAGDQAGTLTSDVSVRMADGVELAAAGVASVRVVLPPPSSTPTLTHTPAGTPTHTPTPSPTPVCYPILINGDFETDTAWELPETAYPAAYTEVLVYEGARAMRLGIVEGEPIYAYSAARQAFALPQGATGAQIAFWHYCLSGDIQHGRQYALLLDESKQYIETVMWVASDAAEWQRHEYTLAGHGGETFWLQFGVFNDGEGEPSAMIVDAVDVQVCGPQGFVTATPPPTVPPSGTSTPTLSPVPVVSPTATLTAVPIHSPTATETGALSPTATFSATLTRTSTPTLTPTATPTPPCRGLLTNGGFESDDGWTIHDTSYPARYVLAPRHAGTRAMALGIQDPAANVYSYSSLDQVVDLSSVGPDEHVMLSFWYYATSEDTTIDRQYALWLDDAGNYEALMWTLEDEGNWLQRHIDLSAHRGQRATLRFGVYNDGEEGVTAMVLDDVVLQVCSAPIVPTPTATTAPTETPIKLLPTVTPRPTPQAPAYVIDTVAVGRAPRGVAVDETTGLVYVSSYLGGALDIVEPNLAQVVATVDLGEAAGSDGVIVDAERGRAFVANGLSHSLSAVDILSRTLVGSVSLPLGPKGVAADTRDGTVYVSNHEAGSISVIDGEFLIETATLAAGTQPAGIVVDEARARLAVAIQSPLFDALALYSLDVPAGAETVRVGAAPHGLALDPTSGRVYSANVVGRSISVVDADGQVVAEWPLEQAPHQVAVNPRTGHLFAVCPDVAAVYLLEAGTGQVLATLPIGAGAGHGIAFDAVRQRVYVTNSKDDTVTVIQDVGRRVALRLPLIIKAAQDAPNRSTRAMGQPSEAPEWDAVRTLDMGAFDAWQVWPMLALARRPNASVDALVVDVTRQRLVVASESSLVAMDALTARPLWRRPLLGAPSMLAVSAKTGTIYAPLPETGELQAYDVSGTLIWQVSGLGHPSNALAAEGFVYVSDSAGARLIVLDARSGSIVRSRDMGHAPHALAHDVFKGRLYVGLMGVGTILALEADTLEPVGSVVLAGLGYPHDLALGAEGRELFVTHDISPKLGAVTVIDTDDLAITRTREGDLIDPLYGTRDLLVDETSGAVWLGAYGAIALLNADTLETVETSAVLPSGLVSVEVDAMRGTVYALGLEGRVWRWRQATAEIKGLP